MNIISKNFFDICVSTLSFYVCGYAFSTNANGGIIGGGNFFTIGFDSAAYLDWFFKYSLCSASTTIISGSLAERCYVDTYIVYTILMTTLIYPIASSWVLGDGWLKQIGFHDAAGAGYIHMLGGVSGLVGTVLLGPRTGIFDKATVSNLVKAATMKRRSTSQGYYIDDNGKIKHNGHGRFNQNNSQSRNSASSISTSLNLMKYNKTANSDFGGKLHKGKNFKTFYNFDEETPMKFRMYLFR
jgi:ammonia channel protein AmtB